MDVTVVVGTYGTDAWIELAQQRAVPSAESQANVIHVHGATLHEARNEALSRVTTEYVIHLDADDELEPGYVDEMARGSGDVRVPSVRYVAGHRARPPIMPQVWGHRHDCHAECLTEGNWIVVGACARVDVLRAVGGWEAFEWSEDWALWSRCWRAGATFDRVPEAVYRAHVRPDSRNRAPSRQAKVKAHNDIHRAVWPELYNASYDSVGAVHREDH